MQYASPCRRIQSLHRHSAPQATAWHHQILRQDTAPALAYRLAIPVQVQPPLPVSLLLSQPAAAPGSNPIALAMCLQGEPALQNAAPSVDRAVCRVDDNRSAAGHAVHLSSQFAAEYAQTRAPAPTLTSSAAQSPDRNHADA